MLGITVPVMVAQADSTLGVGKATEYEKSIVEVTRYRKKVGSFFTSLVPHLSCNFYLDPRLPKLFPCT